MGVTLRSSPFRANTIARSLDNVMPGTRNSGRLPKDLLVLGCSKRKRSGSRKIQAVELYDGPAFRMLRRSLRADQALDVVILSAKYGFISADRRISDYDELLPATVQASEVGRCRSQFRRLVAGRQYANIFVNLGARYAPCLPRLEGISTNPETVEWASGRIGERLHQMKNWLLVRSAHTTKSDSQRADD